jgi:hypothetical protein
MVIMFLSWLYITVAIIAGAEAASMLKSRRPFAEKSE